MMKPFLAAAAVTILLPFSAGAQAADKAGEISALLPVARIERGAQPPAAAKVQDAVHWRDWFETEARGRARLALLDGSQINVGSEARFQVLQPQGATQQTEVELQFGKIRSRVAGAPGKRFEVRTDSAVVGVIGTHFYISRAAGLTTVINLEGQVTVRNADPSVPGEETLEPFELAEIEPGKPLRKRWATLEEILRALEDTLPGPVTQLSPQRARAGSCISASISEPITIVIDVDFGRSMTKLEPRACGGPDIQPVSICVPQNAKPGAYEHAFQALDGTKRWAAFLIEPRAELQDA
ncbi:MAG: FecR family protein, partial [Candidatus Acidiferrales bacterium]